jgi:hypothetical protein
MSVICGKQSLITVEATTVLLNLGNLQELNPCRSLLEERGKVLLLFKDISASEGLQLTCRMAS